MPPFDFDAASVQAFALGRPISSLLLVLSLGWIVRKAFTYLRVRREVAGMPSLHAGVEFMQSAIRAQLPHIPYICPSNDFTHLDPWKKFETARSDVLGNTAATVEHAMYIIGSPELWLDISSQPNLFRKPVDVWRYQAINAYGVNIVSAETGDEWKRHRGVVRACFGEAIMENAWDRTAEAFEMMMDGDKLRSGGVVQNLWRTMERLTLIVIAKAGFDMDMPWLGEETADGEMSFAEALQVVDDNMTHSLLTPKWVFKLPNAHLQRVGRANRTLHTKIAEMAQSKRVEILQMNREFEASGEKPKPPKDLFGALVASQIDNEKEAVVVETSGKERLVGLYPSEIIGNIFTLFVAGHETTAHTLVFTMAFLSVHPEIQDALYREVQEVAHGEYPQYKDMNKLPLCLAACYEALRLRDMSIFIPKEASEDTVISYNRWDEKGNVTKHRHEVKKGSRIIIDTPAIQRNPFHWPEPLKYDPSRHLGDHGKIFSGFSLGQRHCIGKRYAEVELVAFISRIIKTFKLVPVPLTPNESKESMLKRMCVAQEGMTLTPTAWSMRLEKR